MIIIIIILTYNNMNVFSTSTTWLRTAYTPCVAMNARYALLFTPFVSKAHARSSPLCFFFSSPCFITGRHQQYCWMAFMSSAFARRRCDKQRCKPSTNNKRCHTDLLVTGDKNGHWYTLVRWCHKAIGFLIEHYAIHLWDKRDRARDHVR